jgi:hypothetical protein
MIDDMMFGPVILEEHINRTKLPRLSAKWITRKTKGCTFGYTDCYVLSG